MTKNFPLLPLRDVVVFPGMVVPLFVGREKSIAALEIASNVGGEIMLVTQKDGSELNPSKADLYEVGTVSTLVQMMRLPDGTVKALVQGKYRARVDAVHSLSKTLEVDFTELSQAQASSDDHQSVEELKNSFEQLSRVSRKIPMELLMLIQSINSPSELADTIGAHLSLKTEQKQAVLAETDLSARIELLKAFINGEIEVLNTEKRIQSKIKQNVEKSQKEYYLNEQIKAIQEELNQNEKSDIEEFEEKIKNADLPEEARAKASKELRKLKQMAPISAEAAVTRNYLDWILALPWNVLTQDDNSIQRAKEILDADHYGLQEVKDRMLEYLAVRSLAKEKSKGTILCLAGPPGVGKTSIATSLATSLGRKFVRVSLGGVRDEAEIRGHRRTYVGALPGKIITALKKAGTSNPVILLDEIDKMSSDNKGDPSAAMLEVLDPAQNKTFADHYLELEYDLSKVIFIATANDLSQIPGPLRDRMEIITVPGYTPTEKVQIASKYLLPKAIEANGLSSYSVKLTEEKIEKIVLGYTKESGVRELERRINTVARKLASEVVTHSLPEGSEFIVTDLETYLGPVRFEQNRKEESPQVGLVNGLAWTSVGGDMLNIETLTSPGTGKLKVTGKLGEVMKESAEAAYSYVRSIAGDYNIQDEWFTKNDVHIHVPDGATPKDGPSAGITMATALMSAVSGVAVRQDVAMTGEISLRGRVMPIGGLKEKILAAKQAGISTVIVPEKNRKDVVKVPEEIKEGMDIRFVSETTDVLKIALHQ